MKNNKPTHGTVALIEERRASQRGTPQYNTRNSKIRKYMRQFDIKLINVIIENNKNLKDINRKSQGN